MIVPQEHVDAIYKAAEIVERNAQSMRECYTVIGDPVNEAARLTELAKLEEGQVLASAIAVRDALDSEALCWDVGETVDLRGRTASTQLARPVNLAVPTEVSNS